MRGIRSFIGWTHIPDIDSGASKSEDPSFKLQGKCQYNSPPVNGRAENLVNLT